MKQFVLILVACGALVACSRSEPSPDTELADARAQADAATAVDLGGAMLSPCAMLAQTEVQAVIGTLAGEPESPPEDAADTADERCVWRGTEGRALALGASGEGGAERIAAIEPHSTVDVPGDWEQARLQGCCLLHAVRDEAMLSLDFSSAQISLEQAAKLMNAALARVHEPLDTP